MNRLEERVLEIIEERGTKEEQVQFMEDVMTYGCISGTVSELIYYSDTEEWFDEYTIEISDLVAYLKESSGLDEEGLFTNWTTAEEIAEDFESELDEDDYEDYGEYEEAQIDEWHEHYEGIDEWEDKYNKNILAWFSFEQTVENLYREHYNLEW